MPTTTSKTSSSNYRPYSTKRHTKHLRDLNGTWTLSKTLSTGVPSALALQGLTSQARKAFIASPLKLWITQMNYPSQIMVKQFPTAASRLPEQTEKFYPPQRIGKWSEWSNQRSLLLGDTRSRCRWMRRHNTQPQTQPEVMADNSSCSTGTTNSSSAAAMDPSVEEFLIEDVRRLGDCEFLDVEVEGLEGGWCARQVWVVDGFGRLVRRVVTWGGEEGKRAETRLVYEVDG